MSDARLPAHLEVSALIRAAEAVGGFGTVLQKGERDTGVILVLTLTKGRSGRLWERLPRIDGRRLFSIVREETTESGREFADYLARRAAQDRDAWLVELDIADAERLIAEFGI